MAVLRNGPNGGLSGKFGSVIGYRLNGQDIIKGMPKIRKKRKPSALEQANRNKFAQMQAWLKPLLGFLRIGFKDYATTFQGFVAAKSYNSKHAFVPKEDGTFHIDPALVLVSHGTLSLPKDITMERKDNEIVIKWTNENPYSPIDLAMVLAYVPETGQKVYDLAAAKRHSGTASIPISLGIAGQTVQVYIAFVAYDHTTRSNSYYLGPLNV